MLGEPLLQQRSVCRRTRSEQTPCGHRAPLAATLPCRAAPSQAWGRGKGEVTGPPWPFALKSSDAQTSGGHRVILTRRKNRMIRAGTAPFRIE